VRREEKGKRRRRKEDKGERWRERGGGKK